MPKFYGAGGIAMTSDKDDWETPQSLFDELDKRFHFTLDAAASDENHKCDRYYTAENSGLVKSWKGETVFCNPPYGKEIPKWTRKCKAEAEANGARIVMLIPARTDTSYFHDMIYGNADVEFLRGRLKFEQGGVATDPAPFPSMLVYFNINEYDRHDFSGENVYISGPMSGYKRWNKPAFDDLELELKERGAIDVYNPAKTVPAGEDPWTHEQRMLMSIHILTMLGRGECVPKYGSLVLLPEWDRSKGARLERKVAMECGINVFQRGR